MTIKEYLQNLRYGQSVLDKRFLYQLKKMGEIVDYAPEGYLMSQRIYYYDNRKIVSEIFYSGPKVKEGQPGSISNPFDSESEVYESYSFWLEFEAYGYQFKSAYKTGCFNQYLVKV